VVINRVGQSRKRIGRDGQLRYTAYYVDARGRRRSAGTFTTLKAANKAWQQAEARIAEGRGGQAGRGRLLFERYVADVWLPNHVMELTTRQNYTYTLDRHILPFFAGYRIVDIVPADVREWVTKLQINGVRPPTIRYARTVLSAIFTTALNDQITFLHPCMGVKTPTVATKRRRIITPEQFTALYAAIPTRQLRLLVETDVETGLRWGELVELRKRDLDWDSGVITVSRVAGELAGRFTPDGQRFFVKQYPKDSEWRAVTLSAHIFGQLTEHAAALAPDDLLFTAPQPTGPARYHRPETLPDPNTLGYTEPNEKGRRYQHGTLSGYGAGRCRCRHCKDACAAYRARRRAAGKDEPRRPRRLDTDGHIPRAWFRDTIWKPAIQAANIGFHVRFHDLRHAHASWLLAGGADIQTVKERMGHSSITTTQKYLHTLPHADQAAVIALDSIRKRTR
jgi:integrase